MSNLLQHISSYWQHLSTKKIFIACSGGVDSMTLLWLFHQLEWPIEVIHVNYMLRGQDSIDDQLLVEQTCQKWGIPFHLKKIDLQVILDQNGGNLQEIAREIRYNYFEEKRSLSDNNFIALAHHQDDQIETFFMHIARKSGLMGMACMLEEHNRYIRPLLPFSKKEITEFARNKGITWREDYSNKTNKYTRNILRNILLPQLINDFPTLNESVILLIKKFQETQLSLEQKMKGFLEKILVNNSLSIELYDEFSEIEKVELVRQIGLKASFVDELDKLRKAQKGKKINIDNKNNNHQFIQIIREDHYFRFEEQTVSQDNLPQLIIEKNQKLPERFSKNELYIDYAVIKGELKLRRWKTGDRMKPLGMKNGSKLLSDIIKDAKIPSSKKKNIWVVEDGEKIIWCVGILISEEIKTNAKSESLIKITINHSKQTT